MKDYAFHFYSDFSSMGSLEIAKEAKKNTNQNKIRLVFFVFVIG